MMRADRHRGVGRRALFSVWACCMLSMAALIFRDIDGNVITP